MRLCIYQSAIVREVEAVLRLDDSSSSSDIWKQVRQQNSDPNSQNLPLSEHELQTDDGITNDGRSSPRLSNDLVVVRRGGY